MPELTLNVPSTFVERIQRLAAEEKESLEDKALLLLRRGYDFEVTRPEVEPDRSQRPGARSDPRLNWWREAKFGLLIHWGLYSIPAGAWNGREWPGIAEWLMYRAEIPVQEYEKLAAQFNPVKFDAKRVGLAGKTGRPKVSGDHFQTPRWLLYFRLGGYRLRYGRCYTVQARCAEGAGGGVRRAGY